MRLASRVLVLYAAGIAAGCATNGAPRGTNGAAYLETNHSVWLTPEQRRYVACADGQALVCKPETGRLSLALCDCPPHSFASD
jgi:hypothetical protein